MNNLNDKLMLQELTAVITRLEHLIADLKHPASRLAIQPDDTNSRLFSQWQKLLTGTKPQASSTQLNAEVLAAELELQLLRLQNGYTKLARLQQLGSQKLSAAATLLQQSGASPIEGDELLAQLRIGDASHQVQLWQLLDYYQQALEDVLDRERQNEALQHQLCSRLQQLVEELHFSGPVAIELAKIRRQLLNPVAPAELPEVCLRLIDLTIEGVRFERSNAKQYLTKLYTDLEEVHQYAAITLSEEQSLCDARSHHNQHVAGELRAISEHLICQENAQLKADIEVRMRSINHILVQNERLQAREQALLTRMTEMEQQIGFLKQEADHFQQQLSKQNDKLFVDSLTQIHNRAGMDQRLEVEYRQWLRDDKPLCIALLDIDYFKEINDKYGHLAGDKALRLIARTLQRSLRESDFVARFGGEEFTVLLNNVSQDNLETPLQKLREQVKKIPFRFKDQPVTITISLGATLFKAGDTIHSALERADQALYRAKHAGRDQLVID
ncbi:diguanylate cyclase domain-containing protein [Oceanisphaera sp. W20_SRM_FM3]|uniref:GGDEF domain-containing protein n=1 Tax=Oceanisphaera sp. W20_SRM_FM3 TaxID=3240267 RepID=UPI003F9AC6CA